MTDRREDKTSGDTPGLSRPVQMQIGRRLGSSLWSLEDETPPAFENALQKIRKALS